jgi:hypothetical protein
MTKEIDYYGQEDNYIHLKFGDTRKMYNFTESFINDYPDFAREYARYYSMEKSKFRSPFQIVAYAYDHNIPVHFYYNYTDTPAKSREEIVEYLVNENSYIGDLQSN